MLVYQRVSVFFLYTRHTKKPMVIYEREAWYDMVIYIYGNKCMVIYIYMVINGNIRLLRIFFGMGRYGNIYIYTHPLQAPLVQKKQTNGGVNRR